MTTTNGFFLEMSIFYRKITTSNEARDSVLDVDDVQMSSNIYDDDDDGQPWSIITIYLGNGVDNLELQKSFYVEKIVYKFTRTQDLPIEKF